MLTCCVDTEEGTVAVRDMDVEYGVGVWENHGVVERAPRVKVRYLSARSLENVYCQRWGKRLRGTYSTVRAMGCLQIGKVR